MSGKLSRGGLDGQPDPQSHGYFKKPSRFLVSYNVIFRGCSTWLKMLPLQMLRTCNNQYPWLLETFQSLQRCSEGIRRSFLLLGPSESVNDQNHCRTYAIWHGFFCGAYACWHGIFLRACACWHGFGLA